MIFTSLPPTQYDTGDQHQRGCRDADQWFNETSTAFSALTHFSLLGLVPSVLPHIGVDHSHRYAETRYDQE
jgi:hypothetical protein